MESLVQVGSLLLVAGALIISIYQSQQLLRQTATMRVELFHDVSTSLMQTHGEQRTTFFLREPELLSWYLSARGYRSTDPLEDGKRLYALTKLDFHESIYARYRENMLTGPMWDGWRRVLEVDLSVGIFQDVWENGHQFYEQPFVDLVNEIFGRLRSSAS